MENDKEEKIQFIDCKGAEITVKVKKGNIKKK